MGSAIISACEQYRYRLTRDIAVTGPVYAFFGVNPSTADADTDDATVRKWIGFTKRWGGSQFIVGNVFAFRATDVSALAKCRDPFGPDNEAELDNIIRNADILVPCWGSRAKLPGILHPRIAWLYGTLLASGKPVKCLGVTKSGDPRHPLRLGYDTPLVDLLSMTHA